MNTSADTCFIRDLGYSLGESKVNVKTSDDYQEIFHRMEFPQNLDVFAIEHVHETDLDAIELCLRSCQQTLNQSKLDPSEIDLVLMCPTVVPASTQVQSENSQKLLQDLKLEHADILSIGNARCGNMLNAIDMALTLVKSGRYCNILVTTFDKFENRNERVKPFAIFSDAASSCIISQNTKGLNGAINYYEIIDADCKTDVNSMLETGRISADLAIKANHEVLARNDLSLDQVDQVIPTNIFKPIVYMIESQTGAKPNQIHLSNIPSKSHCFASDPIINLVDYENSCNEEKNTIMLVTSVTGERRTILLQKPKRESTHENF